VKSTAAEGYTFVVDGNVYRAAGEYDKETGNITIFNIDEMSDQEMEGILAHEVQHSRWNTFRKEQQKQFTEVTMSVRNNPGNKEDWLIKMDGSLRNPSDSSKYWAYELNEKYLSGETFSELQKKDGISDYSKSYWKQYEHSSKSSGSTWNLNLAIDETLAEIARIEVGASRAGDLSSVDPLWMDFYNELNKRASVKKNKLFLFGGPGSGHHGHEGREGMVGGSKREKGSPVQKIEGSANMYHGTSIEFADEILWDGLKKQSNASKSVIGGGVRPESVYMSTDHDQARAYGEAFATGSYAIVEISIPSKHQGEVLQDEYDLENFGIENNYRIERDVPTEWISKIEYYSNDEIERTVVVKGGKVVKIIDNSRKYYAPVVFEKEK
jgi:hypothetical protein